MRFMTEELSAEERSVADKWHTNDAVAAKK